MAIEKLKKFPAEPEPRPRTPRCESNVSESSTFEEEWRVNRYGPSDRPFQCTRESVVKINGKHYCRLHGGFKALDMYIKGQLVERSGFSCGCDQRTLDEVIREG
jgi:hypothetical protein